MSAEQKWIKVTPKTSLDNILDNASASPVFLERNGKMYEIIALNDGMSTFVDQMLSGSLPPSPYTIETVYGSLLPVSGREYISDQDMEDIIEEGKKENLKNVMGGMKDSA